jgi:hypothetical protein
MPTRKTSEAVLNTTKRKAWREDGPTLGECVWAMHGVWGWDRNKDVAVVLRENYFVKHPLTGKKVLAFILNPRSGLTRSSIDRLVHGLLLPVPA